MAGLVPFSRRNSSLFPTGFEDFYNLLDDFFNDRPNRMGITRGAFNLDIQEDDKEYVVEAHLPGVNKEEVNIELNEGRLTISVTKDEKVNEEKKKYVYKESRYSSMSRSIYLADAKSDGVNAKLENGILYINIPKQEKIDTTKRIEIQ